MPTDHIITLRHNLLSGLLEECQALCDLTIVCRDGKLQCNSLLLFATFRGIDDIFKTVHENTVIIIPDVDIQFLEDFLENVYNQNEIIDNFDIFTQVTDFLLFTTIAWQSTLVLDELVGVRRHTCHYILLLYRSHSQS